MTLMPVARIYRMEAEAVLRLQLGPQLGFKLVLWTQLGGFPRNARPGCAARSFLRALRTDYSLQANSQVLESACLSQIGE